MRSWAERNPGHDYRRFDDEAAYAFLKAKASAEVQKAFLRAIQPAQRADLFRLAFLAAEGGILRRRRRPLRRAAGTPAIPDAARFLGYVEEYGTIANNCLAASPRHPVILLALEGAAEAINRGDADLLWLSTGPGLLTRAFARVAASADDVGASLLRESVLLDLGAIRRSVAIHCHAAYKKSSRHWSRAEFRRNNAGERGAALAAASRRRAIEAAVRP